MLCQCTIWHCRGWKWHLQVDIEAKHRQITLALTSNHRLYHKRKLLQGGEGLIKWPQSFLWTRIFNHPSIHSSINPSIHSIGPSIHPLYHKKVVKSEQSHIDSSVKKDSQMDLSTPPIHPIHTLHPSTPSIQSIHAVGNFSKNSSVLGKRGFPYLQL